jgi:hypothetical protein
MYEAEEVNCITPFNYVFMDGFQNDTTSEWTLLTTTVNATHLYHSKAGYNMPLVYFTVVLKRDPTFFLANMVLPCILITSMCLLLFCLPVQSGEKVSLGITVLLSFTVLLLMMSDITPRASTLPMIGLYTYIYNNTFNIHNNYWSIMHQN